MLRCISAASPGPSVGFELGVPAALVDGGALVPAADVLPAPVLAGAVLTGGLLVEPLPLVEFEHETSAKAVGTVTANAAIRVNR
jgi:hypothetical protein